MASDTSVAELPTLIGGDWSFAAGGDLIDAVNPATGATIARFPRCTAEDVDRAVVAAREAFRSWRTAPPAERARCLYELADAVSAERETLAGIDADDNGSPLSALLTDVDIGAAHLRYFAGLVLHARGETMPSTHDRLNYTLREPYGVVGRIIPFNHPVLFVLMKIAAPLAAGNTVVLKPSEHSSLSALHVGKLIERCLPPGVVNVVTGLGSEAGDALVTHPDVLRLAFIGQAETGRTIQQRAASVAVKHVTLELGGKNPIAIFPDADLELAAEAVVKGMNFSFQGQSCGSTSRLLVQRDLRDEFVETLRKRFARLRVGLPREPDTDVGALINRGQLDKVERYVRLGQEEGAQLVQGGSAPGRPELADGFFVEPAIFDGVTPDMRLAQEEIFGPVLAVLEFPDTDGAIAMANDTRYGLTASVFTRDLATAHRFARDVEAGFVWVNDSALHFLGAPFGGYKESGLGQEEGIEELLSYTRVKNVNVRFG